MARQRKYFTVFEHNTLRRDQVVGGIKFDAYALEAFQNYYGEKGVPYFSLIHNGVKFNEYVGVIQIGKIVVEVLPKADKQTENQEAKDKWRNILINMLLSVGFFDIHAPSSSAVKLKSNSILDLYFELFINEVEYLLHTGLVKKYRRNEGNLKALKGNIIFGKHIQQNYIHQEQFYTSYTTYDVNHLMHGIIYKTISLLKQINTRSDFHSRIGSLLLNFPEIPEIKVSDTTFARINYNRKTECYKSAIEIARLLLLRFHPDLRRGRDNVLAIMFDMNQLWEKFVYVSLKKHSERGTQVQQQIPTDFWRPASGYKTRIRPDIIITKESGHCAVIDTKWKNLNSYKPSPDDLRQMYVYHEYFKASRAALVYPGATFNNNNGVFFNPEDKLDYSKECSVITIPVDNNIKVWQGLITKRIMAWIDKDNLPSSTH